MLAKRLHLLGLLLFGLSWLSNDHYRPWVNFHAETLAGAGVLCMFAGLLSERRAALVVPVIAIWPLVAGSVAWGSWAAGVGLFAGDALIVSLYCVLASAALVIGHAWANREPERMASPKQQSALEWLACLLVFVAILSAAIGLLQWLQMTDALGVYVVQADVGDRALGNMGQPNQLATLLLAGMAAMLFLYERTRIGGIAFGLGIGFLTGVLVLTQSRAGMLSALVVVVLLLVKTPWLSRLRRAPVLIWLAVYFGCVAVLPLVTEWLYLGAGRDLESMTRTSDRLIIWRQMVAGIAKAPWFGYGWNQTPTAHAAGALAVPGSMTYAYAHNVILDLLAWNGVPLGLFWTGLLAWWLVSRTIAVVAVPAIAAMAGLLPLVVHSLLEYPFAYAYFLALGGLLVGVVEAFHCKPRTWEVRRAWGWIVVAPFFAVGVQVCRDYIAVEEDFRIVRFEDLRIGKTPMQYEAPDILLLTQMSDMLKVARAKVSPNMSIHDLERMRRVALRFPWPAVHLSYASALALNGDAEGAARAMRVFRSMFGEVRYQSAKAQINALMANHSGAASVPMP